MRIKRIGQIEGITALTVPIISGLVPDDAGVLRVAADWLLLGGAALVAVLLLIIAVDHVARKRRR
jgi:hypothetical protein